jgi:hypothetical protein
MHGFSKLFQVFYLFKVLQYPKCIVIKFLKDHIVSLSGDRQLNRGFFRMWRGGIWVALQIKLD